MNLTYAPARHSSRTRAARPAALAILYPKVGNVLRVPLRRTRIGGSQGCAQHPERQFIRWFTRMAAARPGFPRQVKSILLLTGEPLCQDCRRTLARYLGQYQLAGKLRVRSRGGEQGCVCAAPTDWHPMPVGTLLDAVLLEAELEGEGWWQRAKDLGKAALLAGALTLGPQVVPKPVYDMAKAAAQAQERRRKMQQTVEQNAPPPAPGKSQQEMEQLETSLFAQELEAMLAQELPTSLGRLGRVGRFVLGTLGAAANPGSDMAAVPNVLVSDGTAIAERNKAQNAVRDNAVSRRPAISGPPPRFGARLPPQGSQPMQLWPATSWGWRSR